jgi:DUF4097 and DUF4098 domain-containing protein YvlB
MSQEISEGNFRVGVPARLLVSNIRGSVVVSSTIAPKDETDEVLAGEERLIRVSAVKHLESGSSDHTAIEMYQEADGRVVVRTRFQENDWLSWLFSARRPCKIDYQIQVPADCNLEVKCVSSSAQIEGLMGNISARTVSGKLTLNQIRGRIEAASVSGRIAGHELTGSTYLDTVSGDIHLEECDLESIEAKSISANLAAQSPLSRGPYHFKSVSGNVRLIVPVQTGCEVNFKHISGRFECDLPVTRRSMSSGVISALVQSGGPQVSFHTISGKLRLSLAQGQYPMPAKCEPAFENNHQVLDQIARGELSVEEALKALN